MPRTGQRCPVWYDPANRGSFVFGTKVEPHAPQEGRRLFSLAGAISEAEIEEQKRRPLRPD